MAGMAALSLGCQRQKTEMGTGATSEASRILPAASGALGAYAKSRKTPINGRTELSLGSAEGGAERERKREAAFPYDGGAHL
jgi:hypothetical protein